MDKKIIESDFEQLKKWHHSGFLESDLLLLDNLSAACFPTEARRMNFIIFALCTRGGATYLLDTRRQQLTPGDILIISEHRVVDAFTPTADLDGLCIMVSVPFFHEIIREVSDISRLFLFTRQYPVMKLREQEQQTFSEYYHFMCTKINDPANHFRRPLLRTLLLAMFYDLSNVIRRAQNNSDHRPSRPDAIFAQFIQLVEANCQRERRVSWYAQQICITPKYLSETIKHVSRRTPNEWIDNYVVLKLRVMLRNTTKSIKQIAEEMNFPNQSFLGKYFKEHVGMSPSQYRKT